MAYPSLLFIHGSATGAWVWDFWRKHLRPFGWEVNVLDLRGHGVSLPIDFTTVTLEDYVADIESVTEQVARQGRQPVLIGWSMGGLLALMYEAKHRQMPALVVMAPVPPLEVGGRTSLEELRQIPPEPLGPRYFGLDLDEPAAARRALADLTDAEAAQVLAKMQGALESGVARRQADRGVSVPADMIGCPVLVLHGEEDAGRPAELDRRMADYYGGTSVGVPDAGHWGIVYHEAAVAGTAWRLDAWLKKVLTK